VRQIRKKRVIERESKIFSESAEQRERENRERQRTENRERERKCKSIGFIFKADIYSTLNDLLTECT
jgi:hypothetical protein